MNCNMIKNNNGYACGMHCSFFKGNSVSIYSTKYKETIFEVECELAGKMIFSVNTGKRLDK